MAMLELSPTVYLPLEHQPVPGLQRTGRCDLHRTGSGRCQWSPASWRSDQPSAPIPVSSKKKTVETLWRELFSDPSQWSDNRLAKVNVRHPDFTHKWTQKSLWLNNKWNPLWVEVELAAIPPGAFQPSILSWNKRLSENAKEGNYVKTVELFKQMQQGGINPDRFTFVRVLNACARLRDLTFGRHIHLHIRETVYESDVYVGSCLVDMYAKCGSIGDAWEAFSKMPTRNVVAWSTMIRGFVKCGQAQKALDLSRQMREEGVDPDPVTFVGMLNACASVMALEEGRQVHREILQSRYAPDVFVDNSLVDMYVKCGSLEDAWTVFNNISIRDIVSWNVMILGHVKCGHEHKALQLFGQMQLEGVKPDRVTFVGLLNACASLGALEEGERVHRKIIEGNYDSDIFIGNSLVDMYIKCGNINQAWKVFNKMPRRDVVSWNTMILGHVKCGQGWKVFKLFQQMQGERVDADPVTFVAMLNACASVAALEEGRGVHQQIIQRKYESEVKVGNSLVDMYVKCGSTDDAWDVFNKLPMRNVVAWSAMILGYAKGGEGQKALELSRQMHAEGVEPDRVTFVGVLSACASVAALEEGRYAHEQIIQRGWESDIFVGSCLVDMYAKCGSIDNAERVFNKMPLRGSVAWSSMILGYLRCGQAEMALQLSRQMRMEGMQPDPVTFVGILNACTSLAALEEGRRVHQQIIQSHCDSDIFVGNCLVDMYAKCGSLEDAWKVFSAMPTHDVVSWNAMLGGCALHGHSQEVFQLFAQMCQDCMKINEVTFVSLLSACRHAGLVDQGLHYFQLMTTVYNISPTVSHYSCMVDLLGRAGHLDMAEHLIESISCEPDVTLWMSLLGACRIHGNVVLGERIAKRIQDLDPENSDSYLLLSNIYAAAGKWDQSTSARAQRLVRGAKKTERSWIEVNYEVHSFTIDKAHPQIQGINAELERLSEEMEVAGYSRESRFLLDDIDDEKKLFHSCHHSVKLAIAFGLISTPQGNPLCIFKDLRLCKDCHIVIKIITKIVGRAILLRDANRFHHFQEGVCSCRDYW